MRQAYGAVKLEITLETINWGNKEIDHTHLLSFSYLAAVIHNWAGISGTKMAPRGVVF